MQETQSFIFYRAADFDGLYGIHTKPSPMTFPVGRCKSSARSVARSETSPRKVPTSSPLPANSSSATLDVNTDVLIIIARKTSPS